jgi:gamma-glutamylcyclotransferase (GGCT)/AIG2-like uncharacterized protein YtfP
MPEDHAFAIAPATHVFVYGTLRRGGDNDITRLGPTPHFMGPAVVQGTLYHLGNYPGMVLGGVNQVVGEVYAITPALERQLDAIEGICPRPTGEYFKREVLVELRCGLASVVTRCDGAGACAYFIKRSSPFLM